METMERSRAATLVAPGKIEIREGPVPRPGPHELLIRVQVAGICGTDLALYAGSYRTDLPLVIGHEFCGRVVSCGAGVTEDWTDAFVTAEINVTCLSLKLADPCRMCQRSDPGHCLERRVMGIRDFPGAFADYIVVPEANAHRLPEDLAPWSGALVEPLAAAIRTFELTPVSPGDTVVILGSGRLGLLLAKTARSHGARVLAVSRSPQKRALSLRFGAVEAIETGRVARERVFDLTEGVGADVVVECTGAPEGLAEAVALVRSRGVVAIKSTIGGDAKGLDPTTITVKELTIQGSRCGPFPKAIERLKAGLIPVEDYISGVFPLEEIQEALRAAASGIKVLLEP